MLARPRHDRWLLSYADLITLLFAAFVALHALEKTHHLPQPKPVPPPVQNNSPSASRSNLLTDLKTKLQLEQGTQQVSIGTEPRGLVLALDEQICFRPGEAGVEPKAAVIFTKVAKSLSQHSNRILLVGHTDSQPIHNARYQSNWELSSARSIAVMRLMENAGITDESRFVIQGSADTSPVMVDNSEEARAQNRRVDIVILDENQPAGVL